MPVDEEQIVVKQEAKRELFGEYIGSDSHALHIGCVGGAKHEWWDEESWFHAHLDEMAGSIVGIDTDKDAVEALQGADRDIRLMDAEEFKFYREFDVIAAPNVIEHLNRPGSMLDHCREHLTDDGRVLVSTPKTWNLHHFLRFAKDGEVVVDPSHTMWFDDPTFRQLAGRHALDVERHETFAWDRDPAGVLDGLYLAAERALRAIGVPDRCLDYQHFYVLRSTL